MGAHRSLGLRSWGPRVGLGTPVSLTVVFGDFWGWARESHGSLWSWPLQGVSGGSLSGRGDDQERVGVIADLMI